ncbi:hypothetical protein QJS10_CPA16g01779 [Acorus calamus]|uniref:Uncharacterized protein n=1 Tax=Acorus calamus TaxID=4465 RepID=A0AAV9D0V6_ACOCL|nr:hypothetical protein QJS10_CPA16g01779 [Acorus calamus]
MGGSNKNEKKSLFFTIIKILDSSVSEKAHHQVLEVDRGGAWMTSEKERDGDPKIDVKATNPPFTLQNPNEVPTAANKASNAINDRHH